MPEDDRPITAAALEIRRCTLCDDDGYTPNRRVCDHENHTDTNRRGIQLVRETMGWT
jgi:hypothetical protein